MNDSDIQGMIDRIKQLYQRRCEILESDNIGPKDAWIHTYEVVKRYPSGQVITYEYAKWQASEPIFRRNPKKRGRLPAKGKDPEFTNHQHIGRVWSSSGLPMDPDVEKAYAKYRNRQQLDVIDKALSEIQQVLDAVEPRQ